MKRPVTLALTLGDPGGIGPEVCLKAACAQPWPANLRLVLVGSRAVAAREARRLGVRLPPVASSVSALPPCRVSLWEPACDLPSTFKPGAASAAGARVAVEWIRAAASACVDGWLDGMVTGPISKEGLWRAGIPAGHTELLASLTGTARCEMMLIGGGLRVVLATRHIPLSEVPRTLTFRRVVEAGEMAAQALAWLGARNRRIAVCALNPHAGDRGAIGHEERDIIGPAVRRLRARGISLDGPVPADTVFHQALRGRYGAVVAMYHDQGLAPLKMLGFEEGVNITLGLPFVRTSPDHGTAFEIAGKGVANPRSMIEAIRLAFRLARRPWRPR